LQLQAPQVFCTVRVPIFVEVKYLGENLLSWIYPCFHPGSHILKILKEYVNAEDMTHSLMVDAGLTPSLLTKV
jgi:hypothetical protein